MGTDTQGIRKGSPHLPTLDVINILILLLNLHILYIIATIQHDR